MDGNDVIAVYKAVGDAIADSKDGPTLIECVTYRMGMHTTSDDPTKYRSDEEDEGMGEEGSRYCASRSTYGQGPLERCHGSEHAG